MDGGTISKLAQRVKELASKFKPQEAANALWALVKLDQQNGGNAMKVSIIHSHGACGDADWLSRCITTILGVLHSGSHAVARGTRINSAGVVTAQQLMHACDAIELSRREVTRIATGSRCCCWY